MKYDFAILGAGGMQGRIVSRDLIEAGFRVALSDIYSDKALELLQRFPGSGIFEKIDVRNSKALMEYLIGLGNPIVVNCVEGDWNLDVYRACLNANCHVIDLGSDIPMTIEQLAMNKPFVEQGLTAITGCGSTPGINNVMMAYAAGKLQEIHTVNLGFAWNSNIKQFVNPFSIQSIIEEFTEPAPFVENGEWKEEAPMNTVRELEFRAIGKQNVFLVRHPEQYTFFEDHKENGLQTVKFYAGFPDHSFQTIKALVDSGFGDSQEIEINGKSCKPVDILTQLFKNLKPPKGYTEKENLWINICRHGNTSNGADMTMECIVDTLPGWEDAGCNIDTGLPASIIAQFIKSGIIAKRGSFASGSVIPVKPFFEAITARGMRIYENGQLLNLSEI